MYIHTRTHRMVQLCLICNPPPLPNSTHSFQIQFVAPADMNRGDEVTVHTTTGPNIVTMNEWRVSFMQTSVLPSASGTAPTIFWLDSDGNCMCFLGLRFHQGCFVMNARFGFWGKEERQDIALGVLGTDSGEETGLTLVVKVTDVGFEIWYNNAVVYTFLHRAPWETFSKVCTGVGCTATRLTVDLLEPAAAADTVAEAQDSHKATVALYRRCVAESDDEFAARNRLLQAVPCEALLVSSPSNMAAKGTWAGTFVGRLKYRYSLLVLMRIFHCFIFNPTQGRGL